MLYMNCTWLRLGCLNVCVGDSSWHGEEIVKKPQIALVSVIAITTTTTVKMTQGCDYDYDYNDGYKDDPVLWLTDNKQYY